MKAYFFQNPKHFWSYYKDFLYLWAKPNSAITYNGIEATTPVEKAHVQVILIFLFSSVFTLAISVLSQQHKPVMQMRDISLD